MTELRVVLLFGPLVMIQTWVVLLTEPWVELLIELYVVVLFGPVVLVVVVFRT